MSNYYESLPKPNLPKSNNNNSEFNNSNKTSIAGSVALSEFGSASSATGITSAELAFRELSDHQSRFATPQRNMSGLTYDSGASHSQADTHQTNNMNNQRQNQHHSDDDLVPDQYYFHDDFSSHNLNSGQQEHQDATKSVHEMHYALLYLMSNTEELQRAITQIPSPSIDLIGSLSDWNARIYSDVDNSVSSCQNKHRSSDTLPTVPLPYIVFAADAEVVLPQAHTASQLFGMETVTGVELEAAAGVPALSQLFLRWLALMPGGDHLNIIDPPGLTVMRISGGRYRVTAAHRVVWTWFNDFLPEAMPSFSQGEGDGVGSNTTESSQELSVAFGDLVTMTIVDVFETDKDGRLLSYCPTFDNRAVHKTSQAIQRISKQTYKMKKKVDIVRNSTAAKGVNKAASLLGRLGYNAAVKSYDFVKKQAANRDVENSKATNGKKTENNLLGSPDRSNQESQSAKNSILSPPGINASMTMKEAEAFDREEETVTTTTTLSKEKMENGVRSEHYISDDETASALTER